MGSGGGRLVISLDFELHWGVRDIWSVEQYRPNLLGARDVVPRLLELFAKRGIRATWATVGFLMAENREDLIEHLPAVRPGYGDRRLDPYAALAEVGADEREDPFHYAPSLVRLIAETPGQEIATHTLSHFYPLASGASAEAFAADLDAALGLAAVHRLAISSIVFPRNQVSTRALAICADRGLTAFRGTERAWYHQPREGGPPLPARAMRLLDAYVPLGTHHLQPVHEVEGLVDVPASRFLRSVRGTPGSLDSLRVSRIEQVMTRAARTDTVFHLWWHPHGFGAEPAENLAVLGRILDRFERLRQDSGLESMTMSDVAQEYRVRSGHEAARPDPANRP